LLTIHLIHRLPSVLQGVVDPVASQNIVARVLMVALVVIVCLHMVLKPALVVFKVIIVEGQMAAT
jgi:hypothetical protein